MLIIIQSIQCNAHIDQSQYKHVLQFEELKGEQKRAGKKILLNVLIYMVPGITIFLLLPSVLFHYIETNWTYLDSVYYAFISLSTIGFGDLVNGKLVNGLIS